MTARKTLTISLSAEKAAYLERMVEDGEYEDIGAAIEDAIEGSWSTNPLPAGFTEESWATMIDEVVAEDERIKAGLSRRYTVEEALAELEKRRTERRLRAQDDVAA